MQEKLYLFLYYYRIIPIPRYIFSGTQVTTQDPEAYKKRGNFIASTFRQAEFYGLPNDTSGKIHIKARFLDSQS